MTLIPDKNRKANAVSETSETSEAKTFLELKIWMVIPYVNGEILNMF